MHALWLSLVFMAGITTLSMPISSPQCVFSAARLHCVIVVKQNSKSSIAAPASPRPLQCGRKVKVHTMRLWVMLSVVNASFGHGMGPPAPLTSTPAQCIRFMLFVSNSLELWAPRLFQPLAQQLRMGPPGCSGRHCRGGAVKHLLRQIVPLGHLMGGRHHLELPAQRPGAAGRGQAGPRHCTKGGV